MELLRWKKDRKISLINFCFTFFTYGLLGTIFDATEFFYFRDTMQVANPALYFGLARGALFGSGLIFSFVGSFYYDNTHNIRLLFLVVDVINVLGNILYLLYISPYIVFLGQFLVGIGAAREVVAMAELARIYEAEELTKMVTLLAIIAYLGTMLGPCATYLFKLVDTNIGRWKLDVNNMVGVFMGSLYLLCFVINFFTLKNLSKEYNVKEQATEKLLSESLSGEEFDGAKTDEYEKMSLKHQYLAVLRALFRNKMVICLLAITFFGLLSFEWIGLLTPIKSTHYLSWNQISVATFLLISFLFGAMFTACAVSVLSKYLSDVDFLLYAIVALSIGLLFMVLFPYVPVRTAMAAFLYTSGIFASSSLAVIMILGRSMLAKMVPSTSQGVAEAIRNAFQESAFLIGGLTITLPSAYMTASLSPLIGIAVVLFTWLLGNRKHYLSTEIIST